MRKGYKLITVYYVQNFTEWTVRGLLLNKKLCLKHQKGKTKEKAS